MKWKNTTTLFLHLQNFGFTILISSLNFFFLESEEKFQKNVEKWCLLQNNHVKIWQSIKCISWNKLKRFQCSCAHHMCGSSSYVRMSVNNVAFSKPNRNTFNAICTKCFLDKPMPFTFVCDSFIKKTKFNYSVLVLWIVYSSCVLRSWFIRMRKCKLSYDIHFINPRWYDA